MYIYCIEGVHLTEEELAGGELEPTVEPMLALLQRTRYCDEYLHRSCATMAELRYRLCDEWNNFPNGSVLDFFTHGAPNQIWSRGHSGPAQVEVVQVPMLADWGLNLEGCHVHFGGCDTFSGGAGDLERLMHDTGASSVSGYAAKSDWLGKHAPAVAFELLLFSLLSEANLDDGKGRGKRLTDLSTELNERFRDCEFRMLVR